MALSRSPRFFDSLKRRLQRRLTKPERASAAGSSCTYGTWSNRLQSRCTRLLRDFHILAAKGGHCHKQTRFRYDPHAAIPTNVTLGRLPHAAVCAGLHCGGNGKRNNAAPVQPAPCAANFTGDVGEGGRVARQGEVFRLDAPVLRQTVD